MIAVDTNVLIYAHRKEMEYHGPALAWLRALASGRSPWGIPVFCLGEFIRVVTHAKMFSPATSLDDALRALTTLTGSPSATVLTPGPYFTSFFFQTLKDADARGNLVFDAQIAAVCREHGANQLLTLDWDFTRFKGLTLLDVRKPPPD